VGRLAVSLWKTATLLCGDRLGALPPPERRTPTETVLLVPGSSEPSFPSDHATAAFAIAFSVLLVGRRLGLADSGRDSSGMVLGERG
jgi:membrane-associated phospholipid phosphatase